MIDKILGVIHDFSYWIAVISCLCCIVLFTASGIDKFRGYAVTIFVGYILLKGIMEGIGI